MKNYKKVLAGMFSMVLSFGLLVVGCDNGGGGKEEDPQVYTDDGNSLFTGSGTIELYLNDTDTLLVGTVTNGKLKLSLPKTIEDKYLSNMAEGGLPVGVTANPAEIMTKSASLVLSKDDGTGGGNISLRKGNIDNPTDTIQDVYFKTASSITGSFTQEGITVTYSINAKAGWNKLYFNRISTTVIYTTDVSKAPSDLKWVANF